MCCAIWQQRPKLLNRLQEKLFISTHRVFALGGCLLIICFGGFKTKATELHGKFWQGETKCDSLFETPVPVLPGGSYLTKIMGDGDIQGHYILSTGGKLRLTVRRVGKIPVQGRTYAEAFNDLVTRRPLQDRIDRRAENSVVLADVRMLRGASSRTEQTADKSAYKVIPNSLLIRLTAKVRVADWVEYSQADEASQQKWDRHQCVSYHHELGHILVAAQLFEDSLTEWAALRAPTREELQEKQSELLGEIGKRIRERQNQYHEALKEMGPAVSESRPYMELPFDWLSANAQTNTPAPQE